MSLESLFRYGWIQPLLAFLRIIQIMWMFLVLQIIVKGLTVFKILLDKFAEVS